MSMKTRYRARNGVSGDELKQQFEQHTPYLNALSDEGRNFHTLPPSVATDRPDYAPGEMVTITANGFKRKSTITFAIADLPSDRGDDGGSPDVYAPFSVTDGGIGDLDGQVNGQVVTRWLVPTDDNGSGSGTPDALNATLKLTATGSDGQVARTMFTDAGKQRHLP